MTSFGNSGQFKAENAENDFYNNHPARGSRYSGANAMPVGDGTERTSGGPSGGNSPQYFGSPLNSPPASKATPSMTAALPPVHFGDIIRMITSPKEWKRFAKENKQTLKGYAVVALFVLAVFWFLSDWTFSFLLTTASIISMSSFCLIAIVIEQGKSCEGISIKMMELWLLIQSARLVAIVPFEGYLPYDKSGDWFYQVSEALIMLFVASILFSCKQRFPHTYNAESDAFRHEWLAGAALVMSILIHPNLNGFIPSDVCWAFALYLEAVSSLPQLFIFQREKKILPWTAHFLAAQGLARVCSMIFWVASFNELHDAAMDDDEHPLGVIPGHKEMRSVLGYWVLIVQGFQLLMMGDFVIQYMKCLATGQNMSFMMEDAI